MKHTIILASNYHDQRYRNKVLKWGSTGKLGDKVNVIALDDDRFYDEEGYMLRDVTAYALQESDLVVVMVGEENMEHPWLYFEGEFCHQWGIKRVIMQIPYTEGALPEEFTLLREIAYNPNAIEKELRPTQTQTHYY